MVLTTSTRFAAWTVPAFAPTAALAVMAIPIMMFGSRGLQTTGISVLINVTLVVGLYIFSGNSGIISFGHMAFMSAAAYAVALLTIPPLQKSLFYPDVPAFASGLIDLEMNPLMAGAIASCFAGLMAMVAGLFILRLSGLVAAFGTFCFLIIWTVVVANWQSLTNGSSTTVGVPAYTTLPIALMVAVGSIWIAYLYQVSDSGLRLRAAREDEYAAGAIGVRVVTERWIAFVVSAIVVGLGGVLYAFFLPFVATDFYFTRTVFVVAMLIIGGMRSLAGAVLGALTVGALTEVTRQLEAGISVASETISAPAGTTEVTLGVVVLLILIVRPNGISGGREVTVEALGRAWKRMLEAAQPTGRSAR